MPPIMVKALREGYYGEKFREVGETFVLIDRVVKEKDEFGRLSGKDITYKAETAFAPEWMEKVDGDKNTLEDAQAEATAQDRKDQRAAGEIPPGLATAPIAGDNVPAAAGGRASDAPPAGLGAPAKAL